MASALSLGNSPAPGVADRAPATAPRSRPRSSRVSSRRRSGSSAPSRGRSSPARQRPRGRLSSAFDSADSLRPSITTDWAGARSALDDARQLNRAGWSLRRSMVFARLTPTRLPGGRRTISWRWWRRSRRAGIGWVRLVRRSLNRHRMLLFGTSTCAAVVHHLATALDRGSCTAGRRSAIASAVVETEFVRAAEPAAQASSAGHSL